MLHLWVETGGKMQDLGLLIPVGSTLELKRRISSKQMGEGVPVFTLRVREKGAAQFMPVNPEFQFPWLQWLGHCVYAERDGIPGVERRSENKGEKVEI